MKLTGKDRVLALDIATRYGYAAFQCDKPDPIGIGSKKIKEKALGAFLRTFESDLDQLIIDVAPRLVVYESPVLPKTTSIDTLRKLYGMAGVAEMVCHNFVEVLEEDNNRVRASFLRPGKLPRKSDERKAAVMQQCRFLGWPVSNHDEADACALGRYAVIRLAGKIW